MYLFFQPRDMLANPIVLLWFWIGFICTILFIYFLVKMNHKNIEKFYNRNFKLIFFSSNVFFAYSHLPLYETSYSLNSLLLSPIFLATYFIAGIVYSIIRLKIGFVWGCLAHICWNLFVTLS